MTEQWQVRVTDLATGYVGPWQPDRVEVDERAVRRLAGPYVAIEGWRVEFRKRRIGDWEAAT